jgi:hypothetical protein
MQGGPVVDRRAEAWCRGGHDIAVSVKPDVGGADECGGEAR